MSGNLISREALCLQVEKLKQEAKQFRAWDYKTGYISALSCVEGLIAHIVTVDAVEVVRCNDCAHARALPEDRKPYFANDIMVCALGRGDPNKGQSVVWPDDFCSDGAKMDEEVCDGKHNK